MLYYFFLGDSPVSEFYVQIKFRSQGTIQKRDHNDKFQIDISQIFFSLRNLLTPLKHHSLIV